MKVLIDTNILISAAYSKGSVPYQAYKQATTPPYQGIVCEWSLEELRCVLNRKFSHRIQTFERFITTMMPVIEIIPVPPSPYHGEEKIRDPDDRPILRAAINFGVDILLTGDKDFLESAVTCPKIMSASEFVRGCAHTS